MKRFFLIFTVIMTVTAPPIVFRLGGSTHQKTTKPVKLNQETGRNFNLQTTKHL